ncbi:MAG: hypothetical protein QOI24_2755 [Acidobacteriota bacterium]|jgi:hypothetical protein|nr:hypothetical protein [Acidobacteriota bacterium]
MHRSARGDALLLVSSVAVAAAPKCPLCVIALAGALGAAGVSVAAFGAWLPRVAMALLAISVASVAIRSRIDGLFALLAAAAIVAGRFLFDFTPLVAAGIVALIVLAIRRARPGAAQCSNDCTERL